MENKSLPITVLLLFSLITISCDMIEVHPYDTKVPGEKNLNAKNVMRIEGMLKGREVSMLDATTLAFLSWLTAHQG